MIEIGGFVGLAALAVALFAWMRGDMRTPRTDLKGDITGLKGDVADLREGQAELRERMARLEGVLDGLREAITWRAGPRDAA